MKDFETEINVCNGYMTVNVSYKNGRLSICGDGHFGPVKGSFGQMHDSLLEVDARYLIDNKWTIQRLRTLSKVWERYHLNDMNAGNHRQELFIRRWKKMTGQKYPGYSEMCEILKRYKLYDDCGYKYGHEWKSEPVPAVILQWLKNGAPERPLANEEEYVLPC